MVTTDISTRLEQALEVSRNPQASTYDIAVAWLDAGCGVLPVQGTGGYAEKAPVTYPTTDLGLDVYGTDTHTWTGADPLRLQSTDIYIDEVYDDYGLPIEDETLRKIMGSAKAVGITPTRTMLLIDADTPEEVAALQQWWSENSDTALPGPTVTTPGLVKDGQQKHKDGGHWYLQMPDGWDDTFDAGDNRTERSLSMQVNGTKITVKRKGGGYFLAPGSERTEGRYQAVGNIITPDQRLVSALQEEFSKTTKRFVAETIESDTESTGDAADRIREWEQTVSWADLLFQSGGWSLSGDHDRCQCDIWTYSRSTSSDKSATAHDPRKCTDYPGLLHLWSDTAAADLERKNFSMWGFFRDIICDGDSNLAFYDAGIDKPLVKTNDESEDVVARTAALFTADSPVSSSSPFAHLMEAGYTADPESIPAHVRAFVQDGHDALDPELVADIESTLQDALQAAGEARETAAVRYPEEVAAEEPLGADTGSQEKDTRDSGTKKYTMGLSWAKKNVDLALSEGHALLWRKKADSIWKTDTDELAETIRVKSTAGRPLPQGIGDDVVVNRKINLLEDIEEGKATPIETELRYAPDSSGATWIDCGSSRGFIRVSDQGVEHRTATPPDVNFHRSPVMLDVEVAEQAGWDATSLSQLWEHVRVSEEDKRLALAWLLMPLVFPRSAVPMLLLHGEPGAAKTTGAARLCSVLDPLDVVARTMPDPDNDWSTVMAATRTVLIDNIHSISQKVSDALCVTVTGGGVIKRELYTTGNVVSEKYKRSLILTSVGLPALKADLASRTLAVELLPIHEDVRRSEDELQAEWDNFLPMFRRILMEIAVMVKPIAEQMPTVGGPRMLDFYRVCQAVDTLASQYPALGLPAHEAAPRFRALSKSLSEESLDPFFQIIVDTDEPFQGRPKNIIDAVITEARGQGLNTDKFPTPRSFSTRVGQSAATMRGMGWTVEEYKDTAKGRAAWKFIPPAK